MSRLLQTPAGRGKKRRKFRRPRRESRRPRSRGPRPDPALALRWATLGLLLVLGLGLLLFGARLSRAEDLSDLQGREASESSSVHNLESRLRICLNRGNEPLQLDEADLNRFLHSRLQVRQGGLFAGRVEVSGIWVRLVDRGMEVIVERQAFGRPHTVALLYRDHGDRWTLGARIGRQEVPAAAARLILPTFFELQQELEPELALVRQMERVTFRQGQVEFQPRRDEAATTQL